LEETVGAQNHTQPTGYKDRYGILKKHVEDYPDLKIPNTTNALDGQFSDLKNKLRNHNGLSKLRKMKFIDGFFKA